MSDDPRIIESQRLSDPRQLRVWLKAIIGEHGHRNIAMRWTDRLKRNRSLTRLLAVCLGVPVP